MKEKLKIKIDSAIKVVDILNGEIKTDLHKNHYIQKLFQDDFIKMCTEDMELGKTYRIDIKITEMMNVSEIPDL